ncbi:metallo proteinase 10 [Crassisporium funariophilum]|nr:metallo proteinase 10 [Crassisporium funariophilum]
MVAFTKSFFPLLLAALLSTSVQAAPWPVYSRHATHRVRTIGKRQLKVESYHPKSTFKTYGAAGAPASATGASLVGASLGSSAISFVSSLGVNATNIDYKSGYTSGTSRFAYVKQSINGIPVANAVANVAFNGDKVVSYGSSFVDTKTANIASPDPTVSWRSVLPQIEETLEGTYNGQNATLEYLAQSDGSLKLTHVIQVQNEVTNAWYEAYIDAHTGELVSVTDFVNDATYTVLPTTKQSFPEGLETLVDPEDIAASPFGWHSVGQGNSTTTSGNNVLSFKGQQVTVQSAEGLQFTAEYNDNQEPTATANVNAARTNAFFILNTMHDFSYRYGFTESSFNFQLDNFAKGGRGQDRVLVSVQDDSGTNNANFATPPDGQSGICRMFIWDLTSPNRDGTMENDVLIHEMTHGITNRLTGGGTGRCLQTAEAGGLGEGWGDAMASWMNQNSAQTRDYTIGAYVFNNPAGLRAFPYSTNKATNPLTYAALQQTNEVHSVGEVWANMLHNVYAALVAERGFSSEKLTNPDGPEGNIVFMRLFMDALSIQPCNPTFVEARDAIIQADENRYNGANKCTVFKAFASRGLGLNADASFADDATLPAGC